MKKIIIAFLPVIFLALPALGANDCSRARIALTYNGKIEQDSRYKEILAEKNAVEKNKYEQWLNETINGTQEGQCNSVPYKCTNGQKNKECVPETCWGIHNGQDSVKVQMDAKEQFYNEKIKECGGTIDDSPDNSSQSDNTSTSSKKTPSNNKNKSTTKIDKAEKQAKKQTTKETECAKKSPPKQAKKNSLGMWVCVETDASIAEREKKKAADKNVKAFWDDVDTAESVFNKKIKSLHKTEDKSK